MRTFPPDTGCTHPSIKRGGWDCPFFSSMQDTNAIMSTLGNCRAQARHCAGASHHMKMMSVQVQHYYKKDFPEVVKIHFCRRVVQPLLANGHFRGCQNQFSEAGNMAVPTKWSQSNRLTKADMFRCPPCLPLFKPRPSTHVTMDYGHIIHYIEQVSFVSTLCNLILNIVPKDFKLKSFTYTWKGQGLEVIVKIN